MRSIGRKSLLGGEAVREAPQEIVDSVYKAREFCREPLGRERFKGCRRTARYGSCGFFERCQAASDNNPNCDGDEGQKQAKRLKDAEGSCGGE